jgi:ribosome maturation protein SDO1
MVDIDKAVIARYKTHGHNFEVLVDCDSALFLKEGKNIPIDEVLAVQKIFSDSKKGLVVSELQLKQVFGTEDYAEAARTIIKKGEVQITADHRQKLLEQKRRKIIDIIHQNGIDPRTKLPHPAQRIELAFEEAKIRIDEHKSPETQIDQIMKELRPILPIHFERREVSVHIPSQFAGKAYGAISGFGKMIRDEWQNDGSWLCVLEIPAGLYGDLLDRVNHLTHGNAETKILKTHKGE